MRKLLLPAVTLLLSVTIAAQPARAYLSDLMGHWSASMVSALQARGLVSGDDQGRFQPDSPLTRAQLAKLLTVGLGYEGDAFQLSKYASRFPDISSLHWARGYIESFTELGITEGYPDGHFYPDEPVTRAQLAAFAIRTLGFAERARLAMTETTRYHDDANIPSWARGSIYVAYQEGIMVGQPDGNFYPDRVVTRAEGIATIYRLLARNGTLYHLSGTLLAYDPEHGSGVVRDALGLEHPFSLAEDANYMRQGTLTSSDQIKVLDQVFIVSDSKAEAILLEARYQDLLVASADATADGLAITTDSGETSVRTVQPGAVILLNGRPAQLDEVRQVGPVYLAFDQTTGAIRLIDAVRFDLSGIFGGADSADTEISVLVDQEEKRYPLAPDAVLIVEAERAGLEAFLPGDEVKVALDTAGRVTYMEATR